jgi:hypothetical protein
MNKYVFGFAAAMVVVAAPAAAVLPIASAPVVVNAANAGIAAGSFTRTFNGFIDEVLTPGLAATINFQLNSVTNGGKTWKFTANILNQASAPFTTARISAMGFSSTPDISNATVVSGPFTGVDLGGNFPQISNVGFCFTAGPNCNGGAGGGIALGGSATQVFNLMFTNAQTSVILDQFIIRWQSLAGANVRGNSGVGLGSDPGTGDPQGVPEPSSWALLIAGFGLVGATMRRRAIRGLTVAA